MYALLDRGLLIAVLRASCEIYKPTWYVSGSLVFTGLIPFETAGRKLEDVTSSNGSEQVP